MMEQDNVSNVTDDEARTPEADPGAVALLVALRMLGIPATTAELCRRSGHVGAFTLDDAAAAAEVFGLRVEAVRTCAAEAAGLPGPALVETRDGRLLVASGGEQGSGVLLDPVAEREATRAGDGSQPLTGRALVLARAGSARDPRRRFGLRTLLPGLLRYRGALAQLLGASAFIQLFAMVTPLFTMVIIDRVLTTGTLSTLNVLVLGLALIAVFDLAIGLLRGSLLANITHRVDVDLVARLFRHLSRLPMSYFGSQRTGDTVARVRELESVRQFLTGPSLTAIIDFAFAGIFLGVMLLFSVQLTLVVVGAIVLLLAIYAVGTPLMQRRLERRFAVSADNQSFLVESIRGMETVKALSLEPRMQRQWEERTVEQTRHARESERMTGALSQVAQFLNKGTVALTLWLGAQLVIAGGFTAGQLIAFNMMVGRVMAPALRLAQLFQQLSQTRISVRRIAEIFDQEPEVEHAPEPDRLPPMAGAVRFEQVSFRYRPDAPEVLREVSFEARPGEVIGIAGASGSGKSSLLRLLQRLYVPTSGRIRVDGVNIAELDPAWLRHHVGAVTQDSVLFNATVRENIAAAQPDLPIEAIERAARLAAADDFIRALPAAYDTPVGEQGARLSVGQRQRIALARALAAEPRMLLLDEPTSALDTVAEREIQQNLEAIAEGRTVFVVAHRLSTLRFCDRVLVLEHGRLVEDGPPTDLLAAQGAFARLKQAQLGGLRVAAGGAA